MARRSLGKAAKALGSLGALGALGYALSGTGRTRAMLAQDKADRLRRRQDDERYGHLRMNQPPTEDELIAARRDAVPGLVLSGSGLPVETEGVDGFGASYVRSGMKKGGTAKAKPRKMASGGMASASKRADGIATKGKTKCKMY
jgi:hypothetical protein